MAVLLKSALSHPGPDGTRADVVLAVPATRYGAQVEVGFYKFEIESKREMSSPVGRAAVAATRCISSFPLTVGGWNQKTIEAQHR